MNHYHISSITEVNEDSFTEGDSRMVNNYHLSQIIPATTPMEAIEFYMQQNFSLRDFNPDNFLLDDIEDNVIYTSFLVEMLGEYGESIPSQDTIEQWKQGNKVLYSNNTTLYVKELVPVDLSSTFKPLWFKP
jgi:serine/threonine protein kinase